jgi:hypothetical protein
VAGITVQDDFMREAGSGDDGERGQSPVVSSDAGASASDEEGAGGVGGSEDLGPAPGGSSAGRAEGGGGGGPGRPPPAPGFSAPGDAELLVRARSVIARQS